MMLGFLMDVRRIPIVLVVSVGGLLGGCTAPSGLAGAGVRRSSADFASRVLLNTDLAAVQPVAERIFREHFRLDPEASSATVLVSRPSEVPGRGQEQGIRDRLTLSPNRQRELAELRLRQEGSNVVAQVSVISQRLNTVERAAFARERGDDRPTETPIDRRGNTSAATREEWTTIGRDRPTEQAVLGEIEQALATTRPAEVP